MGSPRTAVSASLLAASLTTLLAACGHQRPAADAHPSQSVGGTGRIFRHLMTTEAAWS
ncbi:hypothetical protein [Streptomyces sp. NPDC059850]|uniref:hypothetical protein n=1 Tax=Streptomyces sp. NPDC059850 TaxID=3346970 RepID=UPI00366366EC